MVKQQKPSFYGCEDDRKLSCPSWVAKAGSTPAISTHAPVAQLVEHVTLNHGVQGSSPCRCTVLPTSFPSLSRPPTGRAFLLLYIVYRIQRPAAPSCTYKYFFKIILDNFKNIDYNIYEPRERKGDLNGKDDQDRN